MLTAVPSRPHGKPIAPQVSRKGPRRLSSRRLLRPSPASHAVGSSRHSSTPCGRFATAFSSAGNAASETTTGAAALARQHALDRAERPAQPVERRRLAARRAADQRLPQDDRLAPGLGDARRHALAAQAGDGRQQGLRHVVLRRARPVRRVLHPLAPLAREDIQREGGQPGTALLQQAGIDRGPGWRRGRGRAGGVEVPPVVGVMGFGVVTLISAMGIGRSFSWTGRHTPQHCSGTSTTRSARSVYFRRARLLWRLWFVLPGGAISAFHAEPAPHSIYCDRDGLHEHVLAGTFPPSPCDLLLVDGPVSACDPR